MAATTDNLTLSLWLGEDKLDKLLHKSQGRLVRVIRNVQVF